MEINGWKEKHFIDATTKSVSDQENLAYGTTWE